MRFGEPLRDEFDSMRSTALRRVLVGERELCEWCAGLRHDEERLPLAAPRKEPPLQFRRRAAQLANAHAFTLVHHIHLRRGDACVCTCVCVCAGGHNMCRGGETLKPSLSIAPLRLSLP